MSEFLREMKADLMSQNDKVTAEVSQVNEKMDLLAESVSKLRVEHEEEKAELRSIKWQLESLDNHKKYECTYIGDPGHHQGAVGRSKGQGQELSEE